MLSIVLALMSAGPPVETIDAAAMLRRAASGATRLEVVHIPMEDVIAAMEPGYVTPRDEIALKVDDPKAIAALLALILLEPVYADPRYARGHLCTGWSVTRIYRGEELVAEFSFEHEVFIRPLRPKWNGSAVVKPSAIRPIVDWYDAHGYHRYAKSLAERPRDGGSVTPGR